MESISVFDMLKIGIGPSSSHTLGPWRAAKQWIKELKESGDFSLITTIKIDFFGSLSLTGKGHASDLAVMLGLSGADPEQIPINNIFEIVKNINSSQQIKFNNQVVVSFNPRKDIEFNRKFLPFHSNGIIFTGFTKNRSISSTFYSVGGGFVVKEQSLDTNVNKKNRNLKYRFPFPAHIPSELLSHCELMNKSISDIVLQNEKTIRNEDKIDFELKRIWDVMLNCIYDGCHTEGVLPGGLNVRRRAYDIYQKLKDDMSSYNSPCEWLESIRKTEIKFREIFKWVSCFALSVNEVNASFGRVVTAPTNGSAGVVPAVLMYYMTMENYEADFNHIKRFLLVAGEIGSFFKKGATISAAMGGCQAEIGVSSAMAAGALCELLGGTPKQVAVAAEIAMEHHLGLTCDPVRGLVQVPCIERNSMGAIKAINAAELALDTDPKNTKVSLDEVIDTMWETAKDMNHKYKETSEGGLAIRVNLADC